MGQVSHSTEQSTTTKAQSKNTNRGSTKNELGKIGPNSPRALRAKLRSLTFILKAKVAQKSSGDRKSRMEACPVTITVS